MCFKACFRSANPEATSNNAEEETYEAPTPKPIKNTGPIWRCYLYFDPVSNGTLFAKWSDVEVDSLAVFTPAKQTNVPGYLKNSQKPREVNRNILAGSNEKFYEGYCMFIRDAFKLNGTVVNKGKNVNGIVTKLVLLDDSQKIISLKNGQRMDLKGLRAVAVISNSAQNYKGVKNLPDMGFLGKVSNSPYCAKMFKN